MPNQIINGIEYEYVEVCIRYRLRKQSEDETTYRNECLGLMEVQFFPVGLLIPDNCICAKCNRRMIWDDWNYNADGTPTYYDEMLK